MMHLHYAFVDLRYEITIQNIAFACNMTLLDEITVQLTQNALQK